MDEFIGVIKQFAGPYCPEGYMECDGRSVSISQYPALFAVIGTCYGGDGHMSFKLPDFRPYVSDVTYKVLVPTVNVDGNVGHLVNDIVQPSRSSTRRPWNQDEPRTIICVEGVFPVRQ